MTALIRFKPHGGGILDRNKRDGAVLVLGDTMKSASVWSDMSGRGNHGLVYGATTPPPATPQALGYLFDGVDDYVDAGNDASLNFTKTSSFSGSAWINISNIAASNYIFSKQRILSPYEGYGFSVNTDGKLWVQLVDTTVKSKRVNSSQTLVGGVWYHVGFTYNGSTSASGIKIYINGLDKTGTILFDEAFITDMSNILPFQIGVRDITHEPFNGSIDEVRIYNRALSAGEITKLFNRYRGKFGI